MLVVLKNSNSSKKSGVRENPVTAEVAFNPGRHGIAASTRTHGLKPHCELGGVRWGVEYDYRCLKGWINIVNKNCNGKKKTKCTYMLLNGTLILDGNG